MLRSPLAVVSGSPNHPYHHPEHTKVALESMQKRRRVVFEASGQCLTDSRALHLAEKHETRRVRFEWVNIPRRLTSNRRVRGINSLSHGLVWTLSIRP